MFSVNRPALTSTRRICIWLVGVSFVLFQFFLQLSSGVVIGAIMGELQLSALMAGILSSTFYYVYTSMQIPVGMLFDRKNTRFLLTLNVLLCSIGCFCFAQSHSLAGLMFGRLLIGGGSAFAFVGLSHLLRQHFPLKQFGFMIGLSETLGFLATMTGLMSLGVFISHWGWRVFINGAGLVGLVIACFCWALIPDNQPLNTAFSTKKQLLIIIRSPENWINGLFVGLSFTVITVFGALWAVPFFQVKLGCSLEDASILDAMIFLGAAVSCPLFGLLANYFTKRRPLMIASCLSTALLFLVALYAPITSLVIMGIIVFFIGLCCGAYMLAFTIANELAPDEALSTCTGFTNTLAMLSAPLMQPLVGFILDTVSSHPGYYQCSDYQAALALIPLSLLIASSLVFFLPEKIPS